MIHRHYVCTVLPPEPAVIDGTREVPVLDDDDQPVLDDDGNSVTETRPNVVKQALPQRAKVRDFRPRVNYAADIHVDETTGLAVRDWCVAAVNADPTIHVQLAEDPDIWPIGEQAAEKRAVRSFLRGRGEGAAPDTPQTCLERSHAGAKIGDLRAG